MGPHVCMPNMWLKKLSHSAVLGLLWRVKHWEQKQLGRKGVFCLHFLKTVHHQRQPGSWRQRLLRQWRLLRNAHCPAPRACSSAFFEDKNTSPGVESPIMHWASHINHCLRKCPTGFLQPDLVETFSQLRPSFPKCLDIKLASTADAANSEVFDCVMKYARKKNKQLSETHQSFLISIGPNNNQKIHCVF